VLAILTYRFITMDGEGLSSTYSVAGPGRHTENVVTRYDTGHLR